MTDYQAVNLQDKLAKFSEHWSPKIVAQMNDYDFKVVKVQGEFVWHAHPETDEVFFVLKGQLQIAFRDGNMVLNEGEMFVVPKGLESSLLHSMNVTFCLWNLQVRSIPVMSSMKEPQQMMSGYRNV